MDYADYLQTVEWRRRRDDRVRKAGHRCERCPAKRELQVHHVFYGRLGAELDTDLEVLCRTCHEGLHHDESRKQHLGVYVKLVSEALREGYSTFADVNSVVREKCSLLEIPCRIDRIARALEAVTLNRLPTRHAAPRRLTPAPAGSPIGKTEAAEVLKRLGITVPLKSIAPAKRFSQRRADCAKAVAILAQAIVDQAEHCDALENAAVTIVDADLEAISE